jgi:hypothetical protein
MEYTERYKNIIPKIIISESYVSRLNHPITRLTTNNCHQNLFARREAMKIAKAVRNPVCAMTLVDIAMFTDWFTRGCNPNRADDRIDI